MLGVAACWSEPSAFGKLVVGSLAAVVGALALYSSWARQAEVAGLDLDEEGGGPGAVPAAAAA